MTFKIPETVFDGLYKWRRRGCWEEHFKDVYDEHLRTYSDLHNIDSVGDLAELIGLGRAFSISSFISSDFLTRETENGNVVDLYLKQRGWKERAIAKAYLKAVRNSVMTLYEVSHIRPGKSFLARDLIQGGDPILVEESTETNYMVQWEQFAMRIVEVRGRNFIVGELLPYAPELAEKVIDQISQRADDAATDFEEEFDKQDEGPRQKLAKDMTLEKTLKSSAPLFSNTWLMNSKLDPEKREPSTWVNTDGDLLEHAQLRYSFAEGAKQNQLRELLNNAPDMDTTSKKFWNWVAPSDEEPEPRPKQAGTLTYQMNRDRGAPVLGIIELKKKKLVADVNSIQRADKLQERIKDILGDLVSKPILVYQTVEMAMAKYRDRPALNEQLEVPPDVRIQLLQDAYIRRYRKILDKPLPILDGHSPRIAVKTPKGKENVVKWLKSLETSEARLRQLEPIEPYDFTWMWQELGIAELRK